MDSQFIWHMEEVLDIYERPYDKDLPVICFDERPCQLMGDVLVPLPLEPGKPLRQDYHYERKGTCVVLLAVEPLTGTRIVEVRKQKTKTDYAEFMQRVSDHYETARKIILIQDNLNTHNPSSFYQTYPAPMAFGLSQRFDMAYTPKKASWLNMAEIEFSALSKQCLDRRIDDIKKMDKEVRAWTRKRNKGKVKIQWQFTKTKAREKFDSRYQDICV
jgi:DDE superfamily endonuclease